MATIVELPQSESPPQPQRKAPPTRKRERGEGRIFLKPGSSRWWIQYYAAGKRFRESCGSANKQDAIGLLQQRLTAIRENRFSPQSRKLRVRDLLADFQRHYRDNGKKSIKQATRRWERHLAPEFGHLHVTQVTPALVDRYIDKRQQAGAAPATINRELAVLNRMFHLAYKKNRLARVPLLPHLKEADPRAGFVEDADYTRLCQNCPDLWLRTALALAYTYGFRAGELLNLKVRQIDLLHRTLTLDRGTTKNREGRTVVLTDECLLLVQAAMTGKQPQDYVLTQDSKRAAFYRTAWENLCLRAGLGRRVCAKCGETTNRVHRCQNKQCKARSIRYQGLLFHDLRRSAVRNGVRRGVPERVMMAISGHKTRSVFDRYNIVSERDLAEAAQRIEQGRQGQVDFGANLGTVAIGKGSQPTQKQ